MPGFTDTPLLDQVSADSNEPAPSPVGERFRNLAGARCRKGSGMPFTVHRVRPCRKMARRLRRLARFFPGLIAKHRRRSTASAARRRIGRAGRLRPCRNLYRKRVGDGPDAAIDTAFDDIALDDTAHPAGVPV